MFNREPVIYVPSSIRDILNLKAKDTVAITLVENCIKIKKTTNKGKNTGKVIHCAQHKQTKGWKYVAIRLPEDLAKEIESRFGKTFDVRIEVDKGEICAVYYPSKR